MTILSQESARLDKAERPGLRHIFGPISADLQAVEARLAETLEGAKDAMVREIIAFLLAVPGKRIRPALVLLSAGAAAGGARARNRLGNMPITLAAAVELIHMASLVHDDLIDGAAMRHHRASINARWGAGIAVALGDYLCSHAMSLVCECSDPRLFAILGSDLTGMCEGELLQVAGRTRLTLSERNCLSIIESKTAGLFGACCEAGVAVAAGEPQVRKALRQYGVCLGMVFQILDDCRDLLGDEADLGKKPGQDLLAGDMTLPLLYGTAGGLPRSGPSRPFAEYGTAPGELTFVRDTFRSSPAFARVRQLVGTYIRQARAQLDVLRDSDFKESLQRLTDYMAASLSDILAR